MSERVAIVMLMNAADDDDQEQEDRRRPADLLRRNQWRVLRASVIMCDKARTPDEPLSGGIEHRLQMSL